MKHVGARTDNGQIEPAIWIDGGPDIVDGKKDPVTHKPIGPVHGCNVTSVSAHAQLMLRRRFRS